MKAILHDLFNGHRLSRDQAATAMGRVMSGEVAPEQIAAFLGALRSRGETLDEVVGFVTAIRKLGAALQPRRPDLIDTCGTGGDGRDTFNISTAVALLAAAGGLAVAKHGNRSVSSRCGSADVLEALGIAIDLPALAAAQSIDDHGFAFLFAPQYHPALRHAGPVREALGVRTVFNLLGPLANPAGARRQVVGVYDPALLELVAAALGELGSEEALVVCARDLDPIAGQERYLDELSLEGPTQVARLSEGKVRLSEMRPEDAGLSRAPVSELQGGDAVHNAAIVEAVLTGATTGPKRDVVVYNAGAAFMIAGRARNIVEGVGLANAAINSGAAAATLQKLRGVRK